MNAALPHCTGPCHQGRRGCSCSTAAAPQTAEAGTAPAPLGIITRLRIARLRWMSDCIAAEREHYRALGWVGPTYLRESYSQQRRLMTRMARLQAGAPPARRLARADRITLAIALAAITSAAALVLTACGGGGSSDEPAPHPQLDCSKTPEQCK